MKFDVYALKHGFKESHLHARLMYDSKYLSICLNQLVSPFIGNMVKLGPSQDNVNKYLIMGYLSITDDFGAPHIYLYVISFKESPTNQLKSRTS
jgi:hypothetical protein